MSELKLGRLPSIRDHRNLKLASYLPLRLPKCPDKVSWQGEITKWGMMGNDVYGNCVICTAAHILDVAQFNESNDPKLIPDNDVIVLSYAMGATEGFTILERLKFWRRESMFYSKVEAFVELKPQRPDLLKAAIYIFGHADVGVWMPKAWQAHENFWDAGNGSGYRPGTWGGHSVCIVGYEPHEKYGTVYKAISWGKVITITQEAVDKYIDELWVSILPAWLEYDAISPSGFNIDALREDLRLFD